ncbi:uncharacterized protein LOC117178511 [Belonocnema kinseyi]|uniref:uncharacterized protein LOC117178511 n=1 Tax=Belonocnema kinseyi TaxID=2817044 RepID=UPI00143DA211|nr:uncharacterized protein LOC117178511 [Belonocnema kinseyi]
MAVILQGNMGTNRLPCDLLNQMVVEHKVDLIIILEQYCEMSELNWYPDKTNSAAIWIKNSSMFPVVDAFKGEGYVWVRSGDTTFVSVYLSPNKGTDEFSRKLAGLEACVREMDGEVLIARGFNSKALGWGMTWSCNRGSLVLELVARLDLIILNVGTVPAFRRSGCWGTIIDITLASASVSTAVRGWQVLQVLIGSDHQYIKFWVGSNSVRRRKQTGAAKNYGWNVAKLNRSAVLETLARSNGLTCEALCPTKTTRQMAEGLVKKTMSLIKKACDFSMPKRSRHRPNEKNYWWNNEIADLRRQALAMRRKAQSKRRRGVLVWLRQIT